MAVSEEVREKLTNKGANIVGFADLSSIPGTSRDGYGYGILIGVALDPGVVRGIKDGPTRAYYEEYERKNKLLADLSEYAAGLLREKGFDALAKIPTTVEVDEKTRRTVLPHKTVATRAGIGWIGKCALLVTEEYGSALRISVVLTNAELETGNPVDKSRCGECTVCKEVCPAGAVLGENWEVSRDRDEFYNAHKCRKTARERSAKIGVGESLCGLCILKCPWTQRYLSRHV